MIKKIFKWLLGLTLLSTLSWVLIFGFLKTHYVSSFTILNTHAQEVVFEYLNNPNFFPEWIEGYRHSRRVTSSKNENKKIFLLTIDDDGTDFKIILTSTLVDSTKALSQRYEHSFYNLLASVEMNQRKEAKNTIHVHLSLSPNGLAERILAPFFVTQLIYDYKNQYKKAIYRLQ